MDALIRRYEVWYARADGRPIYDHISADSFTVTPELTYFKREGHTIATYRSTNSVRWMNDPLLNDEEDR
jgi:hypothetical protein